MNINSEVPKLFYKNIHMHHLLYQISLNLISTHVHYNRLPKYYLLFKQSTSLGSPPLRLYRFFGTLSLINNFSNSNFFKFPSRLIMYIFFYILNLKKYIIRVIFLHDSDIHHLFLFIF